MIDGPLPAMEASRQRTAKAVLSSRSFDCHPLPLFSLRII